jgi:hypothetical protein
MKGKLTPPEKKRLSYKKDHRTHTGEDDRAMRRAWASRKARVNRKYRRKADAALQKAISPERIHLVLTGDDETTREMIRKGLTRERNKPKWGVLTLGQVVEAKLESRATPRETDRERKERLALEYIQGIIALERHPTGAYAVKFLSKIDGDARLWDFLRDHPKWKKRLETKLKTLRKEEQRQLEKVRIKAEEKRKWRSPTIRLPRGS